VLVNADVKGLELFVAADLSGDETMREELRNKVDLHAANQLRFRLPDRVTAKRFVFKLLYGASAYGYFTDADFIGVGYSQRQWQAVIDEFYAKYTGIAKWHIEIIKQSKRDGYLSIPSGRYYNFPARKDKWGRWGWHEQAIKNYPVQGFGADIVKLARVEFFKRFVASGLPGEFICTVHDSLVVDTPQEVCYTIGRMLKESVESTPLLMKQWFNYDFSLPMFCEVSVGSNIRDMKEINFN
jgi:DNA polymerase-1